jgi:hypothetical protein
MLGIWALGERALGQLIGPGTATLLVSPGSFSLAGQSVTFKGALANAVFAVDGSNSGFSGGTYNQSLLRTGLTPGSLAATIAGSATNSLWAITPAGEPGTSHGTTNYSVVLNVTAGNANVFGSVQFIRTDSIGVFQAQSAVTAEQALTAGTVTFSLGSVGLGTWGATDRLLVVVFLRNSVGSSQNVTIGLGSLTSSNVTYGGAAYALNGQAVTFKFGEVAAPGVYALTGNAASFLGALTAAQGAFALTGFGVTEAFYFNAAGGSYALTGFPALYSHDFNRDSVGSSISGGNFSRQRWRDMLDEEERERAAAARKIADARLRRRAEARHRRRAEAEARRAGRAHEKARGEALADAIAAARHAAAARGLAALRDVARAAGAQARHGHAAAARTALEQDDEDVIALLMGMAQQ